MPLSVVVVSFNVRAHLSRCLDSLDASADVVVVDNASHDGSAELVAERFPSVRLIRLPTNLGFSAAVNVGARAAKGSALLLLNPDARVAPGALGRMAHALELEPSAWALGFRQVDEQGRFQLSVGPPPWLALDFLRRLVQRRLDRGAPRLAALLDRYLARPRPVPWVAGSCLLVRRDAFVRVGGFDEGFFLYFEDIDFCLRLRGAGGRVVYDPSITVVHVRGASAAGAERAAREAYRSSQLRFWNEHGSALSVPIVKLSQRGSRWRTGS